jgi:hypothetical protein
MAKTELFSTHLLALQNSIICAIHNQVQKQQFGFQSLDSAFVLAYIESGISTLPHLIDCNDSLNSKYLAHKMKHFKTTNLESNECARSLRDCQLQCTEKPRNPHAPSNGILGHLQEG